jgi:F-type H+-transporting ATPase subunit delta
MPKNAANTASPAAIPYARSMMELAEPQGQVETIGAELADLRQVLRDNPSFARFLSDPGIKDSARNAAIDRVLRGRVSTLVWGLVGVLNKKDRLGLLPAVADAYESILEERRGIVEVDVTVAHRLSPEDLELVKNRVSQALEKQAVVHQQVDESIIGGIRLRVGDKEIDASVKHQINALRQRLLASRRK